MKWSASIFVWNVVWMVWDTFVSVKWNMNFAVSSVLLQVVICGLQFAILQRRKWIDFSNVHISITKWNYLLKNGIWIVICKILLSSCNLWFVVCNLQKEEWIYCSNSFIWNIKWNHFCKNDTNNHFQMIILTIFKWLFANCYL